MNKGPLVAFVDIFVPQWGIEIHDLTLFKKGENRWINFPSREYTAKDGTKKYASYFRFVEAEKEKGEEFQKQVKQAIDAYLAQNGEMPQTVSVHNLPPEDELPF